MTGSSCLSHSSVRGTVGFVLGVALAAAIPAQGSLITPMSQIVYEKDASVDTTGLRLWINIIDGGSYVDFTFGNSSTIPSVITNIYIESTVFSSAHLKNGSIVSPQPAGVDYSFGATPKNPAGSISNYGGKWRGNLIDISADPPPMFNGIAPGESLTVRFDLFGITCSELVNAMTDPTQFRIAEHVQGLPGGESVWTVNTPPTQDVPLPPTFVLLGVGFFAMTRRRLSF